jgi:hypothetical protein
MHSPRPRRAMRFLTYFALLTLGCVMPRDHMVHHDGATESPDSSGQDAQQENAASDRQKQEAVEDLGPTDSSFDLPVDQGAGVVADSGNDSHDANIEKAYDAEDAQDEPCGAQAYQACLTCCVEHHPFASVLGASNVQGCMCAAGGPCAMDCADTYCLDRGADLGQMCGQCLIGDPAGVACGPEVDKACAADPACTAANECANKQCSQGG